MLFSGFAWELQIPSWVAEDWKALKVDRRKFLLSGDQSLPHSIKWVFILMYSKIYFLKSLLIQAPVNRGMKDIHTVTTPQLSLETSIKFASLHCMHRIWLLDDGRSSEKKKN